jgi:hypothetical protein
MFMEDQQNNSRRSSMAKLDLFSQRMIDLDAVLPQTPHVL